MNLKPVLESREENKEAVTLQKCHINMCILILSQGSQYVIFKCIPVNTPKILHRTEEAHTICENHYLLHELQ